MKLIFAGTPEFAAPALAALIGAGHKITLVVTQPDRPSGRGMKLNASPVKMLALRHQLPVFQPETLKDSASQSRLAEARADAMIVAAYGLILPQTVLDMPHLGCLNIHASLLPRWRGAAPIQRAILAGDAETGVTIMSVVMALDAGPMLAKASIPIIETDTAQTLHDKLATLGAGLLLNTLGEIKAAGEKPIGEQQDEALVTYAAKIAKAEAPLDWHHSASDLGRQVRAFNPFPVAQARFDGEPWRIWSARAMPFTDGKPGEIIGMDNGILVACGSGALCIEELQRPGGRRMKAREFVAGMPLRNGMCFDD
jgi:methionyl-tRNA formyltransferase